LLALLLVVSPQAMPSAPSARTDESAIAFFIANLFSCLPQRLFLPYLFWHRRTRNGAIPSESRVEQAPI
jgi:hypothetical protein